MGKGARGLGGDRGMILHDPNAKKAPLPTGDQARARISSNTLLLLKLAPLYDCALFFFLLWANYYWSINTFDRELIAGYTVETSLFDALLVSAIRVACICGSLVYFRTFTITYWVLAVSFILAVCKIILFSYADYGPSLILVWQLFVVALEYYYVSQCRTSVLKRMPKKNDDDVEQNANTAAAGTGAGGAIDLNPDGTPKRISQLGMLRILKPYFLPDGQANRARVLFTWLFLIMSKASNVLSPIYIGQAANRVSRGEVPILEILLYAGLALMGSVFKETQNVVYQRVKQTAFAQLSEYTFRHLHGLSLDWHLRKKMGNVLRSMDRGVQSADTVVTYLFLYLLPSLGECAAVFVIFYTVFDVPWLSVISLLSLIAYSVLTVKMTLWRKKFRAATNKHDNDYHDKMTDSLINYETVKYFANEEYEIASFKQSVDQYQKYSVDTQVSLSLLNASQQFVIRACAASSLIVCAYRIQDGLMDIGDFVSLNVYLIQLFAPLSFLGTIYGAVIQAFVDMENLSELMAVDQDVKDSPHAKDLVIKQAGQDGLQVGELSDDDDDDDKNKHKKVEVVIDSGDIPLTNLEGKQKTHQYSATANMGVDLEFKDVTFHYPAQNALQGLKKVSFKVPKGTTTAIVGPTGAGKTTIGRLLFRFYDVLGGDILVDGQSIKDVTQKSLRKFIGVVPQDTVMFNDSIKHNIQYGNLEASFDELKAAAKAAQILPFIERQDTKWDCVVGERGLKLSGGEKQRVAIARALLKNPPLVLLDEATSALDSLTENEIQESLIRLGSERTTLVIAHRLSTVKHAEQIIVLNDGQISEVGTHEELLAKRGEYFDLWEMQLHENADEKGSDADGEDADGVAAENDVAAVTRVSVAKVEEAQASETAADAGTESPETAATTEESKD